ncbi:hypothetical protein FG94_02220 [Massilia sp. LC238]|nr:hypothetical protein FG94_02220 [Massilia sp. LC238]
MRIAVQVLTGPVRGRQGLILGGDRVAPQARRAAAGPGRALARSPACAPRRRPGSIRPCIQACRRWPAHHRRRHRPGQRRPGRARHRALRLARARATGHPDGHAGRPRHLDAHRDQGHPRRTRAGRRLRRPQRRTRRQRRHLPPVRQPRRGDGARHQRRRGDAGRDRHRAIAPPPASPRQETTARTPPGPPERRPRPCRPRRSTMPPPTCAA